MISTSPLTVPTPHGPARVLLDPAKSARVTLVLGHGAGGGPDSRDLVALAKTLPAAGVSVLRVEQPWRVAGKRVASAPAVLDSGWLAVLAALRTSDVLRGRLVIGGRSAGARVACRTAGAVDADSVIALAFPLHPPGRPERSRHDELAGAGRPTLVVQGERDSFGRPSEFLGGSYDLVAVAGADHGFAVRRSDPVTQEEALRSVVTAVRDFLG